MEVTLKYLEVDVMFTKMIEMENFIKKVKKEHFLVILLEALKCLIKSSNKIVESANVKVDESAERNDEGNSKEPKDYDEFVYVQLRTPTEKTTEENE